MEEFLTGMGLFRKENKLASCFDHMEACEIEALLDWAISGVLDEIEHQKAFLETTVDKLDFFENKIVKDNKSNNDFSSSYIKRLTEEKLSTMNTIE